MKNITPLIIVSFIAGTSSFCMIGRILPIVVMIFIINKGISQSEFSVVYALTTNTSASTSGPVTASAFSSVGVANAGFESCNGKTGYRTDNWCNDIWFDCNGAGDHADYYTFSITVNAGSSISIGAIEFEAEGTVSNCNWHDNYYETWFSKGAFDYYNNVDCGTTARNAYTNQAKADVCAIADDCAYCTFGTGGAGWTKHVYKAPGDFNAMTVNSGETVTFRIHMDVNNAADASYRNFIRAVGVSTFPLPINILDFKGNFSENKIDLTWSTASEINNEYFTLERSKNAQAWEMAGKVRGAGNSHALEEYRYTDIPEVSQGIVYYRLKQTDYDGNYEYFGPISIELSENTKWEFSLHSPMAEKEITGSLILSEQKNIHMEVIDQYSRRLVENKITASAGANYIFCNISKLNRGIYILCVGDGKNLSREKFIKF